MKAHPIRLFGIGLRRATAIIIASAVVVAATLVATSTASAYTQTTSGRPGSAITYKSTGSFNMGWVSIGSEPVTAYRSPLYTGTQKITIEWRVWFTYGGTWQLVHDVGRTWTVYSNQPLNDPGWTYETPISGGYFSTDVTITWRTSTGAFLGQTYRDYNQLGDYQCLVWNACNVIWQGGQYALFMR